MGRPFCTELKAIKETYEAAQMIDEKDLFQFLMGDITTPLLVIGSGGSYAVAVGFMLCYQYMGGSAKSVTPYELLNERLSIRSSKVLIVTAGGNNHDTVGAYEYVRLYEPMGIYVVCMSQKSKISRLIQKNEDAGITCFSIPNGKDGFLAVNSTIAMFTIMKKLLSYDGKPEFGESGELQRKSKEVHMERIRTLMVLYGGWGKPAAFDLESKCSEAGLYGVQCADYRNFAHGRHNWIDKQKEHTMVVALSTKQEERIKKRTLRLLPDEVEVIELSSEKTSIDAAFDLMIQVFYLVNWLGKTRGIDPGRPQVPEYGGKLYSLQVDLTAQDVFLKMLKKNPKEQHLYRKLGALYFEQDWREYYDKEYDTFLGHVQKAQYRGLILDYDGTIRDSYGIISEGAKDVLNHMLEHGCVIGIATGRGDSLLEQLRNMIDERYHEKIWIGSYNGAVIGNMKDISEKIKTQPPIKEIEQFYEILRGRTVFEGKLRKKPCQISIMEPFAVRRERLYELCLELKAEAGLEKIKIIKSEHAVDIIECTADKMKLVSELRKRYNGDFLCVGDEGRIGSNDFEMLMYNDGLSTGESNCVGRSGWNLAPLGVRNSKATEYYLQCVHVKDGYFTVEFE